VGDKAYSIPGDSINRFVLAHLEQPALAGDAGLVVAAVPGPSNAISKLPFLLCVWDGYDLPDDFVAGDDWEAVAEQAEANCVVGMTDTTSKNLHQNLGWSVKIADRTSYIPLQSLAIQVSPA
jgi:hypothetical protein